jgi:hypothetical protein
MKIKATYKPVSGRRSVSVDGVEFVNGISRTVEVSKTGLAIIKKAAADGWFTIEQEWDEKGNIVTGEYVSPSGRKSIMVEGKEFLKDHPRTVEVTDSAKAIMEKGEEEGWFDVSEEGTEEPVSYNMRRPAPAEDPVEDETPTEDPVTEGEASNEVEGEAPDFSSMTKTELLAYAEENGFEVNSSMTKAEIITAITGE